MGFSNLHLPFFFLSASNASPKLTLICALGSSLLFCGFFPSCEHCSRSLYDVYLYLHPNFFKRTGLFPLLATPPAVWLTPFPAPYFLCKAPDPWPTLELSLHRSHTRWNLFFPPSFVSQRWHFPSLLPFILHAPPSG